MNIYLWVIAAVNLVVGVWAVDQGDWIGLVNLALAVVFIIEAVWRNR